MAYPMNTYAKIGNDWCIRMRQRGEPGQTITVETRAGTAKDVTLGEFLFQDSRDASYLFRIAPPAPRAAEQVGDLSGIMRLFDIAKARLKHPAIVLGDLRIALAGRNSTEPGTVTVTGTQRGADGRRAWYGRVRLDGSFLPGRQATPAMTETLRAFAADPAGEAAKYGRLNGICCFCNRALTDERSTAVGYGPICAEHYGLAWGGGSGTSLIDMAARLSPARARETA